MTASEIQESTKAFILREFLPGESPENLTESTELITSGIIDSLATLKLVSFLEESYGIDVEPHELVPENLNSLADIALFVEAKRGG